MRSTLRGPLGWAMAAGLVIAACGGGGGTAGTTDRPNTGPRLGSFERPIVLAFTPSQQAATIATNGNAIKGATVTAENPNIGPTTYTATTDDKGRFTIIGLRAGQWRFTAYSPGHAGDVGEMSVRFGSPNPPVSFTLRKNGPSPSTVVSGVTPGSCML